MIKTFPIRVTDEFHIRMKKAAHKADKSLHQYIIDAIVTQLTLDETKKGD